MRGASHHPAFMCNYQTISHTFYSLVYPVDKENEDVGLVRDFILVFFVWCESSSLLWLKSHSTRGVTLVLVLWGVGPILRNGCGK